MTGPRALNEWQAVVDEESFIDYLQLLTQDLADSTTGAAPAWSFKSVPEFLHGWARWIEQSISDLVGQALGEPSWSALARQLFEIRHANPRPSPAGAASITDETRVASAADLAQWLRFLGDDCIDDRAELEKARVRGLYALEGRWAHGPSLAQYLDAWHACMSDHHYGLRNLRFNASSWRDIAAMLVLGQIYE